MQFLLALKNIDIKLFLIYSKPLVTMSDNLSIHWQNKDFIAEMNDRYLEYKSGNAQLISLEEVEEKARKAAQKLKSAKSKLINP